MSHIVVLGAGQNGLTTALLLARDGHRVTVLERDPQPPPADPAALWSAWERPGVNQFHQVHWMHPRWRVVMDEQLPGATDTVLDLGGRRCNPLDLHGEEVTGGWQPGDERFETVTARRPVLEAALVRLAEQEQAITIRRGTRAVGLELADRSESAGVPRVVGVRLASGGVTRGDLVVDCAGRRSPVGGWVEAAVGGPSVERRADSGYTYYTRFYRRSELPRSGGGVLSQHPSFSVLKLPADNGIYGIGISVASDDRPLRGLREPAAWEAVLRSVPSVAPWLDATPLTDVLPLAGLEDRTRDLELDGRPRVVGLVLVGDSWACTNPSLGRAATYGALHAVLLRDVARDHGVDDAAVLVEAFAAATAAQLRPQIGATRLFDQHRLAEMYADADGREYCPDDPRWTGFTMLAAGARVDPQLVRASVAVGSLLEHPADALGDPEVRARLGRYAGAARYTEEDLDRVELLRRIERAAA